MLLILISVSACKINNTTPTTERPDYLSEIMKKSDECPQLSKGEFIEITNNYLSTKEWVLPSEKACFYTYGVNYSAYIIENEYLWVIAFLRIYSCQSIGVTLSVPRFSGLS